MLDLFCDENRRNPFPLYEQARSFAPLFYEPGSGLWMVFDYEGVKRVLTDHEAFSSRKGPADWIVFTDPPRHTVLRALISKAFTPRSVINLEPRIGFLARELLDESIERGHKDFTMDFATEFAVPLPMMVIAEMLGIPSADRAKFIRWNDVILNMSYTVPGAPGGEQAWPEFKAITVEMSDYLAGILEQRRRDRTDDLLTRLLGAEIQGERLTHPDILAFFQALLLAGSETTTNLLNSAILCFIEHPGELARLRQRPELLPSAIEEVLRFRSPLQWMFRYTMRDVVLHGQTVPAGRMILGMIGSANRDPAAFADPDRFDIARDPNPHIAFGHGIHFCIGAPLARLEARVALGEFLKRVKTFSLASDEPWQPRKGLHVHGPMNLPIHFEPAAR